MNSPQFLSRGIDYLGDLGAKLRDLQGYRTLAHELIQNADDASEATSMSFDVREEALVVDNNGVFSDCDQIDAQECPWRADASRGHRCDFHRFRHIASGDKRSESGTTGAFGIGFIAVYQITDRPELISGKRHWILHEDRPENRRIQVCAGCPQCSAGNLPGTRFILPWARDPKSALRSALRAEAVPAEGPRRLIGELKRSLPPAMLFLKRLRSIDIRHNGGVIRKLERLQEKGSIILSHGEPKDDQVWHIIRGEFADTAKALRQKHGERIELKRSSDIALAVPVTSEIDGLLCACLPTEQGVGLPFHLNADFYPTNDRKSIVLAADYQSEWNREAFRAAARTIGGSIGALAPLLGPRGFWGFVSRLEEVAKRNAEGRGELLLTEFWRAVSLQLSKLPVVHTTAGVWVKPADAVLLSQKEEEGAIDICEALGINVAHEALRPFHNLLRLEVVSVPLLGIETICRALRALRLTERTSYEKLTKGLDTISGRRALWSEILLLLERQKRTQKARADDEDRLRKIALAPGRDGALWPCDTIYAADDATIELFGRINPGVAFVAKDGTFDQLNYLCRFFGASEAVQVLGDLSAQQLEQLWRDQRLPLPRLLEWFENRREDLLSSAELKARFQALPLFPSAGRLRPLSELSLPGNFIDPLGLAELIDVAALGGRRAFVQDLGISQLDFTTYAASRLPIALLRPETPSEKRRSAVLLLAEQIGLLKDKLSTRDALAAVPLVECTDGEFRQPSECYFESVAVKDCLGKTASIAILPQQHGPAVRDLFEWLGAVSEPRFGDIVSRVEELTAGIYSARASKQIQTILAHLAERTRDGRDVPELATLRNTSWLPARSRADRWYKANELYASYQAYLFESQATFLDLSAAVQIAGRTLLELIGVNITPTVSLVVKHLLHSASQHLPIHNEVYRFLSDNADNLVLHQLRDRKCLLLGSTYYAPSDVFWGEHPFGRFRRRLGEELRKYAGFLNRIEVREVPIWRDALGVLSQISSEFGANNSVLDEEALAAVQSCWRILGQAIDDEPASVASVRELQHVKCIPAPNHVLHPPDWMFFENRAGLAAKFGAFLSQNVIQRPIGTGRAMDEAGVRSLGSAVQVELLECVDPVDDLEVDQRLRSRASHIARVLEAHELGHEVAQIAARLTRIQCRAAQSISIRYQLQAFNQDRHTDPELVPAIYDPTREALIFTKTDGAFSWAAFARELSIALLPNDDPGRFAAGFKEALLAESVEDAEKNLDELGFPRLDTIIAPPESEGNEAKALGTETPFVGGLPPTPMPPAPTEPSQELTPQQAIEQILGGGAQPPTPPLDDPNREIGGAGNGQPGSTIHGGGRKKRRSVLRSYVQKEDAQGQEPDPGPNSDGVSRSPVDEAGIRLVLAFEHAAGRVPVEMHHKNPGYDVESRDSSEDIVRYIEVKSLSGRWKDTYAVLSRTQFDKAMELGELFWLYVVERSLSDDHKVYTIQNPALKANHFMFDDGWSAMSGVTSILSEGE